MKKNNFILLIFLFIGLLTGTIISQLLEPFQAMRFLTKAAVVTWEPRADLNVLKYDFHVQVKINLASILGLIGAFWIYRKL